MLYFSAETAREGRGNCMDLFVLPISEAAALPDAYCAARFPDRFMRSRRMCAEADRLRCIGAGALIAHAMNIDESALVRGEHGKIDSANGMHFNLSHSGDYAILARHASEVGADVERIGTPRAKLAPRVFLPEEIDWMRGDPEARFYALWTLKESVLKLTGRGFSMSMRSFSVLPMLAGGPAPVENRSTYGACLRIGDYAAAICAYEPFAAPEPVFVTAKAILQAVRT